MKIYFDESGQSGCVLTKGDLLNFQKQPTFALGALVIKNDKQEETLCKMYKHFLEKFGIEGEIKGSDLLTKKMNAQLSYFLDNFLNDKYFFVILYDKRFYLSTLLLNGLVGREYHQKMPLHFYEQATFLSYQKDDFFINYLNYIENPSVEKFKEYLTFLVNYDYIDLNVKDNCIVEMAKLIIEKDTAEMFYDDLMTFGWYDNPEHINVINLNALAELVYVIKNTLGVQNENIQYIHDNIDEFEETFQSELRDLGIDVKFANSKEEIPLQIIDNVVSISRKAYDKMIGHIKAKEQWKDQSEWDMKLFSRAARKLSVQRVNYTVPISDWSTALCIMDMFSTKFPKEWRNNIHFNQRYVENTIRVSRAILKAYVSDNNAILTLKQ